MARKASLRPLNKTCIYNRRVHDVVVYSRKGCHLCDIVKETLAQVQANADFQWREVDIDLDPQLREKYNDEVPVVFIDGRKAFKYRLEGRQFLRALARRE
jgi:glutaredoxin